MKNLIISLALLLALDTTGFTCTCMPFKNASKELEQSAAVFSGKVLAVKGNEQQGGFYTSVEVVLEVDRSWKGIEEKTVSVFTSSQSSACGYGFKKGEEYLVYASKTTEGRLTTSICTRTRRIKEADDDLKELGEGKEVSREKSELGVHTTVRLATVRKERDLKP